MRRLLGIGLVVLLVAGRPWAQEAPPPSAVPDVDEELAVVDDLLARQEWKQARDRIVALLEATGPSEVLAPRVRQLDDALGAASFELEYAAPGPGKLPAGKVWEWKEAKRWIRLGYSRATPALPDQSWQPNAAVSRLVATTRNVPTFLDFKPADHHVAGRGLLVHDASFGEQMTLLIEGDLPAACELMPHVFVCVGEAGYYHVQPTWARYQVHGFSDPTQGAITLVQPDATTVLDTDRMPISKYDLRPGRRYKVKVMVTAERIAVTINGMGKLDVARDPALAGQVAFTGFPGIVSTEVKGDVDPRWLEALAVQSRERARQAFDTVWPDRTRGPAWWPSFVRATR